MKLAIDLGGTNIRIAQVAEGKCLKRNSVACLATQDVDVILTQLFELIEPMIGETVEGIGIGVPSIVDTVHGIVYDAMNIASWKEVHLKELLEEKFGLPVAVNNDSNCFTDSKATPTTINIDVPPNATFSPVNLKSIGNIAITAKKNPPNHVNVEIIDVK